ncbi:MAG: type II toxin-antitoxin system ParD family antitoxin [Nitrospinae bacterium]|jgi:antitoxin ParD1/3/4|nr:type II toxin-antitoxin system ParD family antitoxin [Nitrospinota bacterium]MDA1110536.1 type II toxin-antitoxin system ParD family antitoxin [Nitrospinota bacterium]
MASLNVSLPDVMREWVNAQVKGGEYANASDYIRDLIRSDQRKREALKEAVLEGLYSGTSPRKIQDIVKDTKVRLKNA